MMASSRTDLNFDQNRNDETRDVEIFEKNVFPELSPNHDRQSHSHHSALLEITADGLTFCSFTSISSSPFKCNCLLEGTIVF